MQTLGNVLKRSRRKNPISLTPLIDVVFILLVFFMLASSFEKTRTVELQAPKKGKATAAKADVPPVKIEVTGANHYTVAQQDYNLMSLEQFLRHKTDQTILVQTGKEAALQDVVALLDVSARLDLKKFSLLPFEEAQP